MTTVTENVDLPAGVDPTAVVVTLEVVGAGGDPIREVYWTGQARTIAGFYQFALSASGTWSESIAPNSELTPAGTAWRRTLTGRQIPVTYEYATVPASGGPYRWDQVLTDAPASITDSALSAHASDTSLHGGGQELAYAGLSTNFATSSTSYVDVTGASITVVAPARPYVVEAWLPLFVEEAGRTVDIQMVVGASTAVVAQSVKSVSASQLIAVPLRARIPSNTQSSVTTGSSYTYKLQIKSSQTSNDVTVFVLFGTPQSVAYIQAYTV